jgi:Holliday junction resolvase
VANQKARGTRAENQVADELGICGYDVVRSAASKGAADLVGIHDGEVIFVQVKLGSVVRMPSPVERRELLRIARRARGYAIVASRVAGAGNRSPVTVWRELTGTGPQDYLPWVPRVTWGDEDYERLVADQAAD